MAYRNTWFGSSKVYIINSVGQLLDPWKRASNSTFQLACDKGVFSAHVSFLQSLNEHCPNGGRNAMVLATTSETEFDLRFADDILIFAKSCEEIGQVLDMLMDALRQICPVLNAGKTKKKINDAEPTSSKICIAWRDNFRDFGTRPCTQVVGLYDKHPHGWQPRT